MKKTSFALAALTVALIACNNEAKDPVEKADSLNSVKQDAGPAAIQTDQETTDFLVQAANGGMAETETGKMAESKAFSPHVKRFASMMVMDHTGANSQVMALASARNVTLPTMVSEEKKEAAVKLAEKKTGEFDKAYMDQMVKDHKETITLFEKGYDNSKDAEVKTFINNTLPKLKQHLDSAQAIQKMLK